MHSFLQHTAHHLTGSFPGGLGEICVVLPNRRAGLFLRKHLAAEAGQPVWAPMIYSIEDFVLWISGLQEASPIRLLVELYGVHRAEEGPKAQSFEEFLRWAPQLLGDFQEVDRYLADPEALFSTLTEARAIALWNPDGRPLTDYERNYLAFYRSMLTYHRELSGRLLAKNEGGQGLAYRVAAAKIAGLADSLPWKHVVFAGFNALTKAEEEIIGLLRERGKATLLWDMDRYYLERDHQEAGDFLRGWMRKWPVKEPRWIADDYAGGEKDIRILGIPDPIGQVKYCGSLLEELAVRGEADERTAVVLPDEGLLIPLLNSIPGGVGALNITAGLPLGHTAAAGLFELIFQMHLRTERLARGGGSARSANSSREAASILRHPLVRRLPDPQALLDTICQPWQTPAGMIECLKKIVGEVRTPDADRMEVESLFAFSLLIQQMGNLLPTFPGEITVPALVELFRQTVASTALPFTGEPLKGVQVMGMLETRALDFDNVILLSCNEGILPASKVHASFIPFDIKRDFGLPTYRHKDSVYAYHFYRLIQRATRVWILYTTEPDALGGGEPSRYLRQITAELTAYNPRIRIRESVLSASIPPGSPVPETVVEKSPDILQLLEAKASSGLSASTLNAYRNCPLKFYYGEIAGLREPDETGDTIDPATLGTAVHDALNQLFLPYRNSPLSIAGIEEMETGADDMISRAFGKIFRGADLRFGKNLLLVNVAKLMVRRFLRHQREELKDLAARNSMLTLLHLEKKMESRLNIPWNGGELTVRIKGVIDRIDSISGQVRIVDYKTGSALLKNLRVNDWEELRSGPGQNEAFQLLLYAWLCGRETAGEEPVSAGIVSLKRVSEGFIPVSVPHEEQPKGTGELGKESRRRSEAVIRGLLEEIFDRERPFTQTDNHDTCRVCPYINLCLR